jgi:beta-lactamase class A
VFALVFALMAGFVVTIAVSAARLQLHPLLAGPPTAAGARTVPAGAGSSPARSSGASTVQQADRSLAGGKTPIRPASARLDALLAAALRTVLSEHPGQLAVGVIDLTTGQQALYHAAQRVDSASVVQPDILAALLVRHQQAGTPVTGTEADLATAMMDNGSNAATTSLWRAVGGRTGVVSANQLLGLRQTIPGSGGLWGRTKTTVADQLQLLIDLTSARSPLAGPGRDYLLGLMASHATGQRWGVGAAATDGSGYAISNGWLPDRQQSVVNSIGVVTHAGQVLLIAVLSSDNSSEAAGTSLASAAAIAAADVITRAAP